MPRKSQTVHVKLKPADPFELVRWLARSQSDPRKAVAELVQNSLDANAKHIRVVRKRLRRQVVLSIEDDGAGVIPELGREEALRYLASHVGHSRKRGLSAQERADQVVAGQYGVGLLGFWAIGKRLQLQTRVAGSDAMSLTLEEDSAKAAIATMPIALDASPTFTHAVVEDLHPAASRALTGQRLSDYLAGELRGQLLRRRVELVVEDRLARAKANRLFPVTPRKYTGDRLSVSRFVPVEGFRPIQIELFVSEGGADRVQLACAGTMVAEDLCELSSLGLTTAPWSDSSLSGLVDFADFAVPPGTRRGIYPDKAAIAFVDALNAFGPEVRAELDVRSRESSAESDRKVMRDLRRALRGFHQRLPQYEFPVAQTQAGHLSDGPEAASTVEPASVHSEPLAFGPGETQPETESVGLLAAAKLSPRTLTVRPSRERKLTAKPLDEAGREIREGVTFAWTVTGAAAGLVRIVGRGRQVTVAADLAAQPGDTATVIVDVVCNKRVVQATATVTIAEPRAEDEGNLGVVDPELVADSDGTWRSRMRGDRWQVNTAHEDYAATGANSKARMRYLLALIAKEMVQRTYRASGHEHLLDHMVEVLAHAERNLVSRS